MKNKIFLTSMFAVMLAFPAYADLPYGHGIDSNGDGYIGSQTSTTNPAPINSADCDSDPLTSNNVSENYGTYTLTAQYVKTPFHAYYRKGSCYARSDFTNYQDPTVVYYEGSYTVLGLDDISTISLPSGGNYAFDGWTTCWAPCDDLSNVSGCSQNPVLPGSFNWSEAKCLVLTGVCTERQCETGQWFDTFPGRHEGLVF